MDHYPVNTKILKIIFISSKTLMNFRDSLLYPLQVTNFLLLHNQLSYLVIHIFQLLSIINEIQSAFDKNPTVGVSGLFLELLALHNFFLIIVNKEYYYLSGEK